MNPVKVNKVKDGFYLWLLSAVMIVLCSPLKGLAATDPQARTRVMDMVIGEAIRAEFSPPLALAVAEVESDFKPQAMSQAGARGVMQLLPETALKLFDLPAYRLFDARSNIRSGIAYLQQLLQRYHGAVDISLSHYNGGSGVNTPAGLRVIPATRDYVNKVLARQTFYLKQPKVQRAVERIAQHKAAGSQYVQAWSTDDPGRQQSRLDSASAAMPLLDDFSDPASRLNQLLRKKKMQEQQSRDGHQQALSEADAEQAAFNRLPADRQALVSNLRALRRNNLKRPSNGQ